MSRTHDVVIVGGGIIGASIAYHLKADPAFTGSVAVVERDPKYQTCSTVFATGVIRSQFSTPESIQMSLYGSRFLKNVTEHLSIDGQPVDVGFHEHGYIILLDEKRHARLRESHRSQLEHGADIEFVPVAEFPRRFPLYATEGLVGGYFSRSNDGSFDPWSLLQSFVRKARALGAEYVNDTVVGLERDGRRVTGVRLAGGDTLSAGTVIDAAGARDAARIASMVGVRLPVEPRLRVTFYVESTEDLSSMPMTILLSGIWVRPERRRRGFLCGTTPPAHEDAPRETFEFDHSVFERDIWEPLAAAVPAFEAVKVVSAHSGHYDFNPLDENAILGTTPDLDNFIVATGFSGHGVMHAPATGRAISELVIHGAYRTIDARRYGYERVLRNEPIKELNVF